MQTMTEKLFALEQKRMQRKSGYGTAAVEKQHQEGKLTARARIDQLLDPGTFQEIDLWSDTYKYGLTPEEAEAPGDAVVAGWGEVNGRPLYVWAQDATLLGGTMAEVHLAKIIRVMEKALTERVPIVGMYDSEGLRIQSAAMAHSYCSYGTMLKFQTFSSGVIPQISLIMGPCTGGAALSAPSPILFSWLKIRVSYIWPQYRRGLPENNPAARRCTPK
jgi:acetyl-CoA carboxylase carboxyltransferase component